MTASWDLCPPGIRHLEPRKPRRHRCPPQRPQLLIVLGFQADLGLATCLPLRQYRVSALALQLLYNAHRSVGGLSTYRKWVKNRR